MKIKTVMIPDLVLIVVNTASTTRNFNLKFKGKSVQMTLDSGAVGTYIW